MEIIIQHQEKDHKFIAVVQGLTAELDYSVDSEGKILNYHHTFVPPTLRGQGIAGNIVEYALNYAQQNHFKVIPSCPFVKSYINLHQKYKNLL